MFRRLIGAALDSLPAQCEICHAWPSQVLCEACCNTFLKPRQRCHSCALAAPAGQTQCGECLRHPPVLDACIAAVAYEYPWSGCIARFKYGAQPGWARPLAELLGRAPGASQALQHSDLVLPMPLSGARLAERGFNQAHELAKRLAPAKTRSGVLLRIRDTPPQQQLDRAERIRNVSGAFMAAPEAWSSLAGSKLLLVDDVMTSGASMRAAAAALKQAGAASVVGLVLARTDSA
jgi:ComF family protein